VPARAPSERPRPRQGPRATSRDPWHWPPAPAAPRPHPASAGPSPAHRGRTPRSRPRETPSPGRAPRKGAHGSPARQAGRAFSPSRNRSCRHARAAAGSPDADPAPRGAATPPRPAPRWRTRASRAPHRKAPRRACRTRAVRRATACPAVRPRRGKALARRRRPGTSADPAAGARGTPAARVAQIARSYSRLASMSCLA